MEMAMEENPTRERIVTLLKRAGHLTVADMSKEMGITPMAVRQHLMSLEKRGLVSYETRKYGIGRPVFLYSLTPKAQEVFPSAYGKLAGDLLRTVEELDGRKKVDKLFKTLKGRRLDEKEQLLEGMEPFEARVSALAGALNEEGQMAEVESNGKAWTLNIFNCVIPSVAQSYPEACRYELELFRDLLGPKVKRTACQTAGSPACVYSIPLPRA
jgi:predicted ArsR family transcriptional regulator